MKTCLYGLLSTLLLISPSYISTTDPISQEPCNFAAFQSSFDLPIRLGEYQKAKKILRAAAPTLLFVSLNQTCGDLENYRKFTRLLSVYSG